MPRKPRIEYPGAIYHVIQRGNNRNNVFSQSSDKEYLLNQFETAVIKDEVELFAFVILDNHYHLALRTGTKPISKIMHWVNSRYARRFNRLYSRSGHVFEGRYQAIPVENEHYLLRVIRYIHLNPVRAGIRSLPEEYMWSSDRIYRSLQSSFVNWDLMMSIFSNNLPHALSEYKHFMGQEEDGANFENIEEIGSIQFKEDVCPRKTEHTRFTLEEILKNTGAKAEDCGLILSGSRKKRLMAYKQVYAQTASKQGYTQKEIGAYIGLSDAAICKYLNSGARH